MQCHICSKWVHLRCSLLSFFRFKALDHSHSWSFSPCCIPVSSGGPTSTNTVSCCSGSSSLFASTAQPGTSALPNLPMRRFCFTFVFKLPIFLPPTLYLILFNPSLPRMFLAGPASSHDSLRVLQLNVDGL